MELMHERARMLLISDPLFALLLAGHQLEVEEKAKWKRVAGYIWALASFGSDRNRLRAGLVAAILSCGFGT